MSERRFRRTPGRVYALGLHLVWCPKFAYLRRYAKVLWSSSYFAASVGYVWESTVRRYIELQWGAVAW
jgi:hypothetical protein